MLWIFNVIQVILESFLADGTVGVSDRRFRNLNLSHIYLIVFYKNPLFMNFLMLFLLIGSRLIRKNKKRGVEEAIPIGN